MRHYCCGDDSRREVFDIVFLTETTNGAIRWHRLIGSDPVGDGIRQALASFRQAPVVFEGAARHGGLPLLVSGLVSDRRKRTQRPAERSAVHADASPRLTLDCLDDHPRLALDAFAPTGQRDEAGAGVDLRAGAPDELSCFQAFKDVADRRTVTRREGDVARLGAQLREQLSGNLPEIVVLQEVTSYAAAARVARALGYTAASG